MLKNKWAGFLLNLILTILIFFLFSSTYNLLNFINALFYLSFLYLMIVLLMYTIKGGFFDGVTFGFRRFNSIMFKQNDYLEEWRDKPLPSEKFNASFYQRIKFQAISLLFLLTILLLIYYI
ncbi:DUF3899 domain-containing protein [Bacillus sp. OK048]|uniref:DUF3899 domain-containing protein n=1 Tax=Bacillus sp. OK048 TaxID=1882761 RepID=UPI000887EB45|nr:DUF3899 domain-containing protein [Bacillus sp. OK048]SDM98925.1 protein of unknown function [Bacillus sp. OK048]